MANITDPKELDRLDKVCAEAMGWKYSSNWICWFHPDIPMPGVEGYPDRFANHPSPTRNDADSWALLRWCREQGWSVNFYSDPHVQYVETFSTDGRKAQAYNENPAIALAMAVAEMVEGK